MTPFGKIKGLMFDDKPEPDNFLPEFLKDIRQKMKDDGVDYVYIDYGDDINLYYDILLHAEELLKEHFKLKITSRDQPEMIIEHEELEILMDDEKNRSMIHARKPKNK